LIERRLPSTEKPFEALGAVDWVRAGLRKVYNQCDRELEGRLYARSKPLRHKTYDEEALEKKKKERQRIAREKLRRAQEPFKDNLTIQKPLF
jgi:hypothetical protein